jgi:hypothetical protein
MGMTTVQQVCTDVRNQTDQANSEEVSDSVTIYWTNKSQTSLYDLIIPTAQFAAMSTSTIVLSGSLPPHRGHFFSLLIGASPPRRPAPGRPLVQVEPEGPAPVPGSEPTRRT